MESLIQYFSEINAAIKTNPILAAGVAMYGVGMLTWLIKGVPSKIFNFLKEQTTTTLYINNSTNNRNEIQFQAFLIWFMKNRFVDLSRTMELEGDARGWGDESITGAGYGKHYFFYKRRLFVVNKVRMDSQGTGVQKQELAITGFTRNHKIFHEMIEEFKWKLPKSDFSVYQWNGMKWSEPIAVKKRSLTSVILADSTRDELFKPIERFVQKEAWYVERGMPYKHTTMLYGVPGTGKTSIVKAIASHYGRKVYCLNLSQVSDRTLVEAVATMPRDSILLIEDFEGAPAAQSRRITALKGPVASNSEGESQLQRPSVYVNSRDEPDTPGHDQSLLQSFEPLTFSGLFNTLDGIVSLDGIMIFLSTNDITKLDPALIRKGRIDNIVEIKPFEDAEVRAYVSLMLPETQLPDDVVFSAIPGCDLAALFMEHHEDPTQFIQKIPQRKKALKLEQPTASRVRLVECGSLANAAGGSGTSNLN